MTSRSRAWLGYAMAWVPIAGAYILLINGTRAVPLAASIEAGFTYVVPAALMGVIVWWISSVIEWPERWGWYVPFFLGHASLGAVFGVVWQGTVVLGMATRMGFPAAVSAARVFLGWQVLTGVWVYGIIAGFSYLIRTQAKLREQQAAAARSDALRVRAELQALRAQLNPHFLFNTLHTLTALVRRDPATAELALERFGDMLRYVLDARRAARDDVSLAEEWQFVERYLSLEGLRYGDRLRVEDHLDPETLDSVIPTLTLQPLVENALRYGIAPRIEGGTVRVASRLDGETLVLEVSDDGAGADEAHVLAATGIGLRAVRERLATRHAGRATVDIRTAPGAGFTVTLRLPAHSGVLAADGA